MSDQIQVALFIAVASLVISIVWNIINSYFNLKRKKQMDIQMNIPMLKGQFKKYYKLAEDVYNRMIFSEGEEKQGYKRYKFSIKKKESNELLDKSQQNILIKKLAFYDTDINELCKLPSRRVDSETMRNIQPIISPDYLTIPNSLEPEKLDDISKIILENIKENAKELGIKI